MEVDYTKRYADCGHTTSPDLVIEDCTYGDTICPLCLAGRGSKLRKVAYETGDYTTLHNWYESFQTHGTFRTSDHIKKVAGYPIYAPKPSLDLIPVNTIEVKVSVSGDTVSLKHANRRYSLDMVTEPITNRRVLPDEAFTEVVPLILLGWKTACETISKNAYIEETLSDYTWNTLGRDICDGIQYYANKGDGRYTLTVDFQSKLSKTAAMFTQVEDIIHILMGSTTVINGVSPKMKWSGTAWRCSPNHFVTCAHVVNPTNRPGYNASEVSLTVLSTTGENVPCRTVYVNYDIDCAVLEIGDDYTSDWGPPLKMGDSSLITPGEQIITVGAPEGINQVASVGFVSSYEKHIPELVNNVFFIDLDIHPGSSGGPVCNMRAEVVGIARGSHGRGEDFDTGLNYCVPITPIKNWITARLRS